MVRIFQGKITALVFILFLTGCSSMDFQEKLTPLFKPERKQSTQPQVSAINKSGLEVSRGANPEKQRYAHLLNKGHEALATEEVGYYMDIQEAGLRQKFSEKDILIKRERDFIQLVIPGTAMFTKNSVSLNPASTPSLDSIADVLSEYNKTLVAVEGYTDNTGVPEHNQRLSEQRALSAGNYLASKGVAIDRLIIVGFGENNPLANNSTEQGRSFNRRIELKLYPLTRLDNSQAQR